MRVRENRANINKLYADLGVTKPGILTSVAYGGLFGAVDGIGMQSVHVPLWLNIPVSVVMGSISMAYFQRFTRNTYGINNVLSFNAHEMQQAKKEVTLEDIHAQQRNKMLLALAVGAASGIIIHNSLEHQTLVSLPQSVTDISALVAGAMPPVAVGREVMQERKFLKSVMSDE